MAVSRAQLLKELMPALSQIFDKTYAEYAKPIYTLKFRYGNYAIYKSEMGKSTRLAKGLSRDEAEGMMKLLQEYDDE